MRYAGQLTLSNGDQIKNLQVDMSTPGTLNPGQFWGDVAAGAFKGSLDGSTIITLSSSGGSSAPTGTSMIAPEGVSMSGYLERQGQPVSRSTYSTLFTAISTAFGKGDGSTTFNLPVPGPGCVVQVTGSLPMNLRGHAMEVLADGRIFLFSGMDEAGAVNDTTDRGFFGERVGNNITWTPVGTWGDANLHGVVYGASVLNPNDGSSIVVFGGADATGVAQLNLVNYISISGTTVTVTNYDYFRACKHHTATVLADSRVLITGGVDATEAVTDIINFYTPNGAGTGGNVVSSSVLPTTMQGHSVTLLPDGRVLLLGGIQEATTFTPTAVAYFGTISGDTISWTAGTAMPVPKAHHTATMIASDRILVIGACERANPCPSSDYLVGIISSNTITWVPYEQGHPAQSRPLQHHKTVLLEGATVLTTGGLCDVATSDASVTNALTIGSVTVSTVQRSYIKT